MEKLGTLEIGMVAHLRDRRRIRIIDITRKRIVGYLVKPRNGKIALMERGLEEFVKTSLSEICRVENLKGSTTSNSLKKSYKRYKKLKKEGEEKADVR